jgi:hypothetical protein
MPPRKRAAAASSTTDDDDTDEEWSPPRAGGSGRAKAAAARPATKTKQPAKGKATAAKGPDAAAPAAAPPSQKPQKRKKKDDEEEEERRVGPDGRTVRWSAAPSKPVLDRIHRALPGSGHRMFLISSQQLRPPGAPGGAASEYVVLGATGNVYNVEISRHPTCDCPDHVRGNLCKHVLFVYLRALKVHYTDPLIWQKALLAGEVGVGCVDAGCGSDARPRSF